MAELFFLQASDNAFDRPPSVPHRKIHEQKPEVYYIEEQITGNERSSPSASHADPTLYHLQRSSPESSHDQRTTPVSNQEAFRSRPETYHLETQPPSSSGSPNYSPDVQPTVIMYVLSASEGLKNFDKSHSPSPSVSHAREVPRLSLSHPLVP